MAEPRRNPSLDAMDNVENPPPSDDELNTNENEPFLPASDTTKTTYKPARWHVKSTKGIVAVIYLIIILISFGGKLTVVPITRIYEFILCHYHYNSLTGDAHIGFDEDLPEAMCKGSEVQEKLNVLMAGLWMLGCIPALLTTVPYGSLADRVGRRPIFALAMLGMILTAIFNISIMASWKAVPLQVIWLSPVFLFIGGGEAVANMMFYAMANDIVPEEQRATIFLLGSAGSILGDMLAPTLSSFLMMKSPWIPVLGGMSIVILSSGLIFIIPETLYMGAANPHTKSPDPATISTESVKHDDTNIWTAIRSRVFAAWNNVHEFTSMLHSLPTLLLLLTFIVGPFGRVGGDMFLRYVSNRYHWTLAQTGFLLSLQAFFSLFLVVLVLPGASYLLVRRFDFSNKAKDLLLAQFSLLMLTIGALAIAFAPEVQVVIFGLAIWTFGNGYPPIARSLITTQVDPQHVGRLFAAIAMIELICYMGAGPLGAVLYHIGLQKRGAWEGLPYICFAVVNSFAVVCLFIFGYIKRRDWKRGDIRL